MPTKLIYISPHLDDAILSCGGLIYEQIKAGKAVEVWTVTAGIPDAQRLPEFARQINAEWGINLDALQTRLEEDKRACEVVGAKAVHLPWLDCIYRYKLDGDALIKNNDALFDTEPEAKLVTEISQFLLATTLKTTKVISPMAIGNHIDHLLTVKAIEESGLKCQFYADYPYVSRHPESLAHLETSQWQRIPAAISKEGLKAWQQAILMHRSQISTFWQDKREVKLAIANYCAGGGGRLWKRLN